MKYDSEKHHRRSIRLKNYNYAQSGAYFITVVAYQRQCIFGGILNGGVELSVLGHIVTEEWERSNNIRHEIELDTFVVMPNHIHGVVIVANRNVGANGRSPLRPGPRRRSLGAFVSGFKASVTKRVNEFRGMPGVRVWQRNYYEHVIRNEESLNRIRQYISDNPARWEFDRENPAVLSPEAEDIWRLRK